MKILVLGSGAREKTIIEKLSNKHDVCMLYVLNFLDIRDFCIRRNIELVIPSNEDYLCRGIVDYLSTEIPSIMVFGPNKYQSQIEGSKYFSKLLMETLSIPTAPFIYFSTLKSAYRGNSAYREYDTTIFDEQPVLKYSGLAAGKGVYLPKNKKDTAIKLAELFKLGDAGVIVEKRLFGKEVSVLAFCNGKEAILMPQTQDYKSISDNNDGPNTGGMGAICPTSILTNDELIKVKKFMDSVVDQLKYIGILYAGLIKTDDGVFFLEFNCRFGDPEAQVILNLLDSDLCNIILSCINKENLDIQWSNKSAATVILSHEDYPNKKLDNSVLMTYKKLDNSVKIYESNVKNKDGKKYTTGGRVLSMVSIDNNIQLALQNIYNNIYKITYPGVYYRKNIGSNNLIISKSLPSLGVLASGNGTCLEYLFKQKKNCIKLIITNKSDSGIIYKACFYKVPLLYIPQNDMTEKEYYEKIVNILRLYNVELVILAGYMKIVPDILFDEFFTINIHPSLLPNYAGKMDMDVHESVIRNKETFSGCTLHEVVKDIDAGRILMQKQYKLQENETAQTLKHNIQDLEKQCIFDYITSYNVYKTKTLYGVDVKQGNEFIENIKSLIPSIGGFCAEYSHNGMRIAASADGCGTKLDLANTNNKLDTIGIDLVAMNVNDLIAGGARPLFFMDYIAMDKMNKFKCTDIIKGILEGCRIADCKLIGGETAEMGGTYLKNKCDLAGFAVGEILFDLPKKNKMHENCILYGIESSGIHSNGYTLVRKILETSNYKTTPTIEELLCPTTIYSTVTKLCELFPENILGISHITGGGFKDNIIRILPLHLYFKLDEWEFPSIFKWLQKESKLSREEMLDTFNCGYGMVIISNQELDLKNVDFDFGFELEKIGILINS
jgi:phosphoribosylamine--glycine ligase/phosphoribosylaminoimidazole synthetase